MQKPFLLAALFLLLPLSAVAQELDTDMPTNDGERAVIRIATDRATRAVFENDPSGFLMFILATGRAPIFTSFNEEFGITQEQVEHFDRELTRARSADSFKEIQEILIAMGKNFRENADYVQTEDEDAALDWVIKFAFDSNNSIIADVFTNEQIQKMDGMILALTGGLESPFFNERHMAALNMTAEQKEKFKKINEDTKPEREKMAAAFSAEIEKMVIDRKISINGLMAALGEFKDFSRDLKNRRSEVLTPAQIAKVRTLTRLPRFLSLTNLLPQWMPGADSWKPGDPLPAGAAPPPEPNRGRLFPRGD
jgi:hypothetical protein